MTPQQEHIALQNFKTSMIQSGHGNDLNFDHSATYFVDAFVHARWLGYKRCWEEQVLKEVATKTTATGTNYPAPVTVADDFTPPNPNEEEFMFVGGPLHGPHMWDRTKRFRIVIDNNEEVLYQRNYVKG
jgi:hypothetical protein